MLFSCKITSSVLSYLERRNEDITLLLESTPLPEEFLKDPSYWMQAEDMERFLKNTSSYFTKNEDENLLSTIGHVTPELRSWGVFDSVLRMMSMQDVLAQPKRFLSYFISPEPPVDNIVRTATSLKLDLPIPADQFPFTTSYLRSSFETLPVFSGKEMAKCRWDGMSLSLEWDTQQKAFLAEKDLGYQVSPELMRSIVAQLEKHQLELQQKNAELEARNEQLRKAYQKLEEDIRQKMSFGDAQSSYKKQRLESVPQNNVKPSRYDFDTQNFQELKEHISRLGDYMVRAQQLMTIVASSAQNLTVKEAMRRMDWNWVKEQFPLTLALSFETLKKIENYKQEKKNV